MVDPKPNDMMTCPYDMSHQIEQYRMHIHLQKCRKQHPNCNKLTCPFDATHIISDVELDFHTTVCNKRLMFDRQVYVTDDEYRPPIELPPMPNLVITESWDDDSTTSYKPELAKKGAHIITKIKGATPSERRKARMEGVKNYRPLENQ